MSISVTTADNKYLLIDEAVEASRSSRSTIKRKIASGELKAVRFGRRILIDRASFDSAFEPVTAA